MQIHEPSRPVSRILSPRTRVAVIYLGRRLPAASCGLPGGRGRRAASRRLRSAFPPAWPCSRWGLPGRACHQARRWSLTPPFHPYRPLGAGGMFLWHCPSGHPAWPLASTVPCGVRTFLERLVDARDRPAGWAHFNYSTTLLPCQGVQRQKCRSRDFYIAWGWRVMENAATLCPRAHLTMISICLRPNATSPPRS